MSAFRRIVLNLAAAALSLTPVCAAGVAKTIRVEHGRPVVVASQTAVLVLEFVKEPRKDAEGAHDDPDLKHCRARYRYQLYTGATGSVASGDGTVEEILRVVSRSATGQNVKDEGSRTAISAGEFSISWSQATAGSRSWLYYRADSAIRFIQQPQRVAFGAMDRDMFRRYLASRNVEAFESAEQTVHVIGPAVFSGDMPDETQVSARIESLRVRNGAVELTLSNLALRKNYVIESSYELKSGNWNVVHTFRAAELTHSWTDPLPKETALVFYRIREGL